MKNFKKDAQTKAPEVEVAKTFTSAKGVTVDLVPVSQFKLDSLRQSQASDLEAPPTYTVEIVGGASEEHSLDEISAKNSGRLDEWNAYLERKKKQDNENNKSTMDLCFYDGVKVDVPGEDSEWQKVSEKLKIKVPSDPVDRKLHYIYTEVLVGGDDIAGLFAAVLAVSQLDPKVVAKIRNSFRAKKERDADSAAEKEEAELADKQPDV